MCTTRYYISPQIAKRVANKIAYKGVVLFACTAFSQVCLEEYFDSEDCQEIIRAISELACPEYHYEVVSDQRKRSTRKPKR